MNQANTVSMETDQHMQVITEDLIRQYDIAGPRYTSYPTADRFVSAFDHDQYANALSLRRKGLTSNVLPLSIYIHIPFCESLCYYCACNKIITKHYDRALNYLDLLEKEIELQTNFLGAKQSVSQLHLGGGSPTFINDDDLHQLMITLREKFNFTPKAEMSIEIDPRTVDSRRLEHLKKLGFNRISFGVQDFDPSVQQAIHRIQPFEQVKVLMQSARSIGFESINTDLIYGLPKQTPGSFNQTLKQIIELSPDRIAIYGYAHLPERFKPQRRILTEELPNAAEKITMLSNALKVLESSGYAYIGMDHFAKETDSLTIAKNTGRLHRNFQGYSTQPDGDLLAFGVSSIGKVGATYSQNAKTIEEYADLLAQGQIPVVKGLRLSREDLLRRAVIMAIMCQGEIIFESIQLNYLIDFKEVFKHELDKLAIFQSQGMLTINNEEMKVTKMGWYFIRAIAMQFDKYLNYDFEKNKFSKII
jgi:oxygen-independent coproporphyrinogen-3 oxidase